MIAWLEHPSLPTNWRETTIEEAYVFTRRPRALQLADYPTVPFVPMEMIPAQGATRIRWLDKAPDELTSGNYFERGDVLLSRITPSFENGKQGIADGLPLPFGFGSTELIPIQAKHGESDVHFLFYLLLHPALRSEIAARMEGSTGRQRVPEAVVRKWPIPLPPPDEQRKIAAVLSKVQSAVEVEGELIRVTRELKQAALRQLFSRGLRGEPQKQSEIGPIPESWDVAPLSSIREFLQYGTSAKCASTAQGTPVLRIPNIVGGGINAAELKYAELPEKEAKKLKLTQGDVLFVRTNGQRHLIGRCAVYKGSPVDAVFASYLIRARFKPGKVDPDYFQYYSETNAGRSFLAGQANGAADGKFNLNTQALNAALVPLPQDPAEQREIADHLATIDAKLAHHEARQKLLRELFRTLLRDLMTARRRVTGLNMAAFAP